MDAVQECVVTAISMVRLLDFQRLEKLVSELSKPTENIIRCSLSPSPSIPVLSPLLT